MLGRELKVRFERWHPDAPVAADASADEVLEAYRPFLDKMMGEGGAGSADVVKLTPDHPQATATRDKFLNEHTHSEDEVRFFVEGSANFLIHANGKIYDAFCTKHDLISVPAGAKHWLDAGVRPDFTVLRIFTDTQGWVAEFTGTDLATRFPAVGE